MPLRVATVLCLIAVAVGCGRLGFGDARDSTVDPDQHLDPCPGHDEDEDGIGDLCDVCPHAADPSQTDNDGDRVGNACDPDPAVPRQTITMFDPFTMRDPAWNADATVRFELDSVEIPEQGGSMSRLKLVENIRYEVGGEIEGYSTSGIHQFYLGIRRAGETMWYGEFLDDAVEHRNSVLYTVSGSYTQHGNLPRGGLLPLGPFVARLDVTTAPAGVAWHVESGGTSYDVKGMYTEDLSAGTRVQLFDDGIQVRLRYAVMIETR